MKKDSEVIYLVTLSLLAMTVPVTNVSLTHVPSSEEELLSLTNGNVVLTCTTNCAHPAPVISWFENDQPFRGSATFNIRKSGCSGVKEDQKRTISTITVTAKYEDKTRTIYCTAENVVGERNVSKAVNIKHNAMLIGGWPQNTNTVMPGTVEVKQGNNISLWCILSDEFVNGVPVLWQSPPNFKTRTSDCNTFGPSPVQQKYMMSCSNYPSMSYNMTITNVKWADRGKYRCIHTRHMGIVDLNVLVPVTNMSLTYVSNSKSEPLFLSKNDIAVLTCTTNCANPVPTISWFENDQTFKGSAIINKTESGCTGKEKGQKRTISTVTVTGKYVDKERKRSRISCMADNVIGVPKIIKTIGITYDDPCERVRCHPGRVCRATSQNPGVCVCGPPDLCNGHRKQVCGDDGVMYPSHCELHRMACIKDKHNGVDHTNSSCIELTIGETVATVVVPVLVVAAFAVVIIIIFARRNRNKDLHVKWSSVITTDRETSDGLTVDDGNDVSNESTECGMNEKLLVEDPASKLKETQKKRAVVKPIPAIHDQEQQGMQPGMVVQKRGPVTGFNISTGREKTKMEDLLEANDRLFFLLDRLEWSLVVDRIEDALREVSIIKHAGRRLKEKLEGVKTQIEKSPKLREAELKLAEDKYKELEKREEEASRQLHDYEIAQIASRDAVARFSRDENQARLMHEEAENAFTNTCSRLSWFPWAAVQVNLDHAKERLAQAEAHVQATTDAKIQEMKAQADVAERYAAAKKAHKECKTEMKTIGQMIKVLKIAAAFTTRACAELEIILDLPESDCCMQELKQAVKREFSEEAKGADVETTATLALIPAPVITEYRFWATRERWQYVKETILANPEYFE